MTASPLLLTFLLVPLLLHRGLLSWILSSSWRRKFGRKQRKATWKYTNKSDFYILRFRPPCPPYWISVAHGFQQWNRWQVKAHPSSTQDFKKRRLNGCEKIVPVYTRATRQTIPTKRESRSFLARPARSISPVKKYARPLSNLDQV